MSEMNKDQALEFLKELETTLNKELPGPIEMESWIRQTFALAKANDTQKQLRLPEAAFLNGEGPARRFRVASDTQWSVPRAGATCIAERIPSHNAGHLLSVSHPMGAPSVSKSSRRERQRHLSGLGES